MPQLDFFIISQLTIFYFSFSLLLIFLLIFFTIISSWLINQIKIFFKVDLINSSKITNLNAIFFYYDLLEQFVLVSRNTKSLVFFIFAVLIVYNFVFFNTIFFKASEFVSSIIKDLNQDNAARFGKNWINLSTIFIAVLFFNLTGILPFSFTLTSSLAAPFFFSFTIMFLCIFNIIAKNKFTSFAGFLPAGTSIFIAPLIILIEIVSNFAKFISLGIRLFANMFAGHLLLKVFYSIGFQLFAFINFFVFFSQILVLLFVVFITMLEIMIAGLQAFVMLLLSVLYIRESESFVGGH